MYLPTRASQVGRIPEQPGPRSTAPARTQPSPPPGRPARTATFPWTIRAADAVGAVVAAFALCTPVAALVVVLPWVAMVLIGAVPARPARSVLGGPLDLRPIRDAALTTAVVVEVASSLERSSQRGAMLLAVLVAAGWSIAVRIADRQRILRELRHGTTRPLRLVVVGTGAPAAHAIAGLGRGTSSSEPVAMVDRGAPPHLPGRSGLRSVLEAIDHYDGEAVLVLPSADLAPDELRRLGWMLERRGTPLLVSSGIPAAAVWRTSLTSIGSLSVLEFHHRISAGPARWVKEIVERTAATLLICLVAPVLLALALAVRYDSPGSALFRQVRVGRHGRMFTMLKFRTMEDGAHERRDDLAHANDADDVLFKIRRDPRVTRIGRVLRRYSLDELPQLWNVVRGDMALVGPRPALPAEVAAYDRDTRRRLAVKPGLTGLWQVSGRSDLPWRRAVELDLYYVDNWSLGFDLWLVARTIPAVLGKVGAY